MTMTCQASWYTKDQSGWLWYKHTPKKSVLKPQLKKDENKKGKESPSLNYREQAKKVRENFEEVQAKAVLNPTIENVTAFQKAQNTVLNQAEVFQKMLMLAAMLENGKEALLASPDGRKIYQERQLQDLDFDIKNMSKQFGLFFLVKEECPYCHQFAPVIKGFLDKYPFDIKVISKKGLPLGNGLPRAVPDNGTIDKLNPEGIFPLLLLVNPHTREVIPVARGLINEEQLNENFRVVIQFLKNHQVRGRK